MSTSYCEGTIEKLFTGIIPDTNQNIIMEPGMRCEDIVVTTVDGRDVIKFLFDDYHISEVWYFV